MRKSPGKNNFARGASRGKMLGKRQRNNCECGNGRMDLDFKNQLRLRMRRTLSSNFRKPMQLDMANLIFGSTTGVKDVIYWTVWKVRPPPKRKKEVRTA
jgi:hypothetical protein